MSKKRIKATVAIVDTRYFTRIFEVFEKKKDDSFIKYMEEYYQSGYNISNLVSFDDKVFFKTSGDGYIVIFYGKNHESAGYLFGLLLYKALIKKCNSFNKINKLNLFFGIGIDTGDVIQINSNGIDNFLGSVINRASRIESVTKLFDNTHLIIGEQLYLSLIELIYGDKEKQILKSDNPYNKSIYKNVLKLHNDLNQLSQRLMLFYLFKHRLKGVEKPTPLYRLSPSLADFNLSDNYLNVIKLLCNNSEKFEIIKKEIDNYR